MKYTANGLRLQANIASAVVTQIELDCGTGLILNTGNDSYCIHSNGSVVRAETNTQTDAQTAQTLPRERSLLN